MAFPIRIISGLKPSTGDYHKITIYDDQSIRIERPFCLLDHRCEIPMLRESNWQLHKHFIWLIEAKAYSIKAYCFNESRKKLTFYPAGHGNKHRSLYVARARIISKPCQSTTIEAATLELRSGIYQASTELKKILIGRYTLPEDLLSTQLQLF